jgi:hypothetical protein
MRHSQGSHIVLATSHEIHKQNVVYKRNARTNVVVVAMQRPEEARLAKGLKLKHAQLLLVAAPGDAWQRIRPPFKFL